MPPPESFLQHLRDYGYHPRSDKHSNALATAIIDDLIEACPPLAARAKSGQVVYALNFDLRFGSSTWNVDLVLGTPAARVGTEGARISRGAPATVQIALEIKSVMTEHRKAVKNRKRDFEAHHEHVHNYSRRTVAAGAMVVNSSLIFTSPLRTAPTSHGTRAAVSRVVEHCVTEMRNVTESGGGSDYGMDAKTLILVDFDNVDWPAARYVGEQPSPQVGDPLQYDSFIQKLCAEYAQRFP